MSKSKRQIKIRKELDRVNNKSLKAVARQFKNTLEKKATMAEKKVW